ncbi:uncharacterized protein ALTATR162_LOCUS4319 [Alternaria atra]|uniref:F-box domain-containing protein n=1 Tax=Alternaria atra TaxID=119953 RepID=A0A8J2I1F3_9PLEO|nr:uncharacterized protein ALTATR162_LOCUS4319 [Alternaria atra]CAG5156522.1 unnamed protein product [Alternaria atra]
MQRLPVELKQLCIEGLDDDADALKALRLVNKELGTLATKALFSKAVLNPTDESAAIFKKLVQSKYSENVQCVVINTSLCPDTEYEFYWSRAEESEILESFTDAIGFLHSFPRLDGLQLIFAVECAASLDTWIDDGSFDRDVEETPQFRSEVLGTVINALCEVPTLKSLSIKNLQDHMDRQLLESEVFGAVRDRITRLHLQITTERKRRHALELEAVHQGFTVDLPGLWLKPLSSQLTHLTLYSYTCMWGLFPFVELRDVGIFPCLESLSLGNYTFAHDWQIDWILSHGPTLNQLLLDDCPIVTALRMREDMAKVAFPGLPTWPGSSHMDDSVDYFTQTSLHWHDIFDRFQFGLPHLQHFAIHNSFMHWANDAFDNRYKISNILTHDRYHVFDVESVHPWREFHPFGRNAESYEFYRQNPHPDSEDLSVKFPECDDEDAEALERLMKVVNARAESEV